MTTTLVHSVLLVSHGTETPDAWVLLDGPQVAAVGQGTTWRARVDVEGRADGPTPAPPGTTVVDGTGKVLVPGFVDVHGHGALGVGYEQPAGPTEVLRAVEHHRSHGSTHQVLSLATAPLGALSERLALVAELTRTPGSGVLGSHLEGPWLALSHCGAHDTRLLRTPSAADVARLLAVADGTLVQVTLAPELPGATEAIRALVDAGAVPAVGHTGADLETTQRAFDAGARVLTHALNGMPGLHHRAPGPVAAALADDRVTLEVVNDGVHVHPAMVALLAAQAPGRVALVTDAGAATGQGDGTYRLGSMDVRVADGVARLAEGGSLAGSTLTLDAALRRAVQDVGLPLGQAVGAVTEVPARAVGRPDLGVLQVGSRSDAVLLDARLRVDTVWFNGRSLPGAPNEE